MEYIDEDPGPNKFKITELWAFVSQNEGGEGLISHHIPGQGWMPLIGADKDRVDSLMPLARDIQKKTGKKVKLMHFRLDSAKDI